MILGAGPAGLAAAAALAEAGRDSLVVDPADRVGGSIRTTVEDGWIVETGPNTLQLEQAADHELLCSYGLSDDIRGARTESAKRFILSRGRLHALRPSPLSLLTSGLLSPLGRLRLLAEPFIPRGGHAGETVAAFATRRFGREASARLMDPVVSGVHAGDPDRLDMAACFPSVHRLEAEYGSVILGLIRRRGHVRNVVGFRLGMQQLADAMRERAGRSAEFRLGWRAERLKKEGAGWSAVIRRSTDGAEEPVVCDRVIVTTPPWKWKDGPFDVPVAERLSPWSRCEAPPVTVVARGYDLGRIHHPLDGFGYLTPGEEGRRVLGCLFPSSVIPGRAPESKALLCCFLGGARQPAVARRDDDELRGIVDRELSETLGASGPPEREWIQRWEQAIPQYDHDQRRREACLAALEREEPGIRFHGAFRGGISLMHAVRGGDALGRTLAREA